jgi:hypothetical protein
MIQIKTYDGYQYEPRRFTVPCFMWRGYMSVTKFTRYKKNPVGVQYIVNYAQITAIKPVDQ